MPRYQLAMTEAGRDRTTITFDDSRSLAEMVIAVRSDGALTISGNWKILMPGQNPKERSGEFTVFSPHIVSINPE